MQQYTQKIKEISKRLLDECRVETVIGFRRGTLPMMNQPCFAKTVADVDQFVWDSNCGVNLANYLTHRKEKIAIVAKGCDSRNIVTHIIENKIERDQLYIIGVPCKGMVDKRVITEKVAGEITAVGEADGKVTVTTADGEETFDKADVLQQNCSLCVHRNPVIYDEMVAEPVAEQTDVNRYADVAEIEALDAQGRWDYFEKLLSTCIRCYACRNACPLCYCPTCFVDESKPQWVGKSQDAIDTRTFHFLCAYHRAGRCTDCGSCERVCPVGINMRVFTKKLEKDCLENFNWEAGMSPDERPPLDWFRSDDPEGFIK